MEINNISKIVSDFQMVGYPKIVSLKFDKINEYKENLKMKMFLENKIVKKENKLYYFEQEIKIGFENSPFEFYAKSEAKFICESVDEEEKKMFLTYTAPANIISYLRPILNQIVIYSGLPEFQIPLLNIYKVIDLSEK